MKLGCVEKIDHPALVEWSSCDTTPQLYRDDFADHPAVISEPFPDHPAAFFFRRVRHPLHHLFKWNSP